MNDQYKALVGKLAIPHRAPAAYRELLSCGLDALPAVREGLQHRNADVRYRCCQFLDHFLTPQVVDDLVAMLDDPDHRVRYSTLHSLACDRCKEGSWHPDETRILPRAIALLADDPDPHVRAFAIELVARWVHTNPDAEAALLKAKGSDSSPTVRKKAGWYAPGGTIYRRTAPNVRRSARKQASA